MHRQRDGRRVLTVDAVGDGVGERLDAPSKPAAGVYVHDDGRTSRVPPADGSVGSTIVIGSPSASVSFARTASAFAIRIGGDVEGVVDGIGRSVAAHGDGLVGAADGAVVVGDAHLHDVDARLRERPGRQGDRRGHGPEVRRARRRRATATVAVWVSSAPRSVNVTVGLTATPGGVVTGAVTTSAWRW